METSREAQAQFGLTFYFLGKTHAGLRKLSAYYKQRGFSVSNVASPDELADLIEFQPPHVVLIDLQAQNEVGAFMDVLDGGQAADVARVAVISSTTDSETAEAFESRCNVTVSWPLKATDLSTQLFDLLIQNAEDLGLQQTSKEGANAFYRGEIHLGFLRPLLQILYLSRSDCSLSLESEGRRGNLWFKEGKLIDAQVGALDWEESLDLIRQFPTGSFALTFQDVNRKRFIEQHALLWLTEREASEAAAKTADDDESEISISFLDVPGDELDDDTHDDHVLDAGDITDSHELPFIARVVPEPVQAFEVTTSTKTLDVDDEDDDDSGDDDEDDSSLHTLPALRAVRQAEILDAGDYEDDDDEYDDDDDYYDDDDDEYDDDDYYDDDDDEDFESEHTVARVSLRLGRMTRDEVERRVQMEAIGVDDQPVSGTRITPATLPRSIAEEIQDLPFSGTRIVTRDPLPTHAQVRGDADGPAVQLDASQFVGELPTLDTTDDFEDPQTLEPVMTVGMSDGALDGGEDFDDYDEFDGEEEEEDRLAPIIPLPISPPPSDLAATQPLTAASGFGGMNRPPNSTSGAAVVAPAAAVASSVARPVTAPAVAAQAPPAYVAPVPAAQGINWKVPAAIAAVLLLGFIFWPSGDELPEGSGVVVDGSQGQPLPPVQNSTGRTERDVIQLEPADTVIKPVKNGGTKSNSGQTARNTKSNTSASKPPQKQGDTGVATALTDQGTKSGAEQATADNPSTSDSASNASVKNDGTIKDTAVASLPKQTNTDTDVGSVNNTSASEGADTAAGQNADNKANGAAPDGAEPEDSKAALLLADARNLETNGKLEEALVLYARAVDMDKGSKSAKDGVTRVQNRLAEPSVKTGQLIIQTVPYGLVYIDGEKSGYTPVHNLEAVPRVYVIRITHPDYGACQTTREVKPGERAFVHLRLDDDQACGR